ncbi:hypothetical protein SAMN06273572_102241 [Monaibacterium marinum]|uniref:Uncharacterized protein n=1 Tax=Pontivivens marinum TaxID=1690039 RepID=A0A2C9CQF1_9RHOB|nr:hypothetical protein [Monaibacterium marinum]SOH93564.1 hypothetical protein SAMN06273572_102241 [Monaibacterium marinum]
MTTHTNFKLFATCAAVLIATSANAQSIDEICDQIANLDPFIVDDEVERMCQPIILGSTGNVRMSDDGSLIIDFDNAPQNPSTDPDDDLIDVAVGTTDDGGVDLAADVGGIALDLSAFSDQGVTVTSGLSGSGSSDVIQAAVGASGGNSSGSSLIDADVLGGSGTDTGSDLVDVNVFSGNDDNDSDVVDIDVASSSGDNAGSIASVEVENVASVDVGGSSRISANIAGISVSIGN